MIRIPKGTLKVIRTDDRATSENEYRVRASQGEPRRLVPIVEVNYTNTAGKHLTAFGYGLNIKGVARLRYNTTRFPLGSQYGKATVRVWLETTDAVDVAETLGELEQETNDGPGKE